MTTKKDDHKQKIAKLTQELHQLTQELHTIRLDIKANVQSNTNAHKPLKTKRAQLLHKIHQLTKESSQ